MGSMQSSRESGLRSDVDKNRDKIISSWSNQSHCNKEFSQNKGKATLSVDTLEKAANALSKHFSGRQIKVLEVFAGNCVAGQIINKQLNVLSWLYTDISTYKNNVGGQFNKLDCVDAVRLFGPGADVLMMISPPYSDRDNGNNLDPSINHSYGDYYACKDFIDQTEPNKKKCIVFIGELGASDGSPGMYKYLLQHKRLKLSLRKLLFRKEDIFGPLEKEVFVFDIQ